MKQMLFMSVIVLSLCLPAHAALDEKTWKEMSDSFQLGYLWGMMDTTVAKVWDRPPEALIPGKEINDREVLHREMIRRTWREGVDKHMAECIRDKIVSPMKFQTMLDNFIKQERPEPSDSIQELLRHILWRTCVGPP
jgi:hypothetical protein